LLFEPCLKDLETQKLPRWCSFSEVKFFNADCTLESHGCPQIVFRNVDAWADSLKWSLDYLLDLNTPKCSRSKCLKGAIHCVKLIAGVGSACPSSRGIREDGDRGGCPVNIGWTEYNRTTWRGHKL
jgi:hypothetical protein